MSYDHRGRARIAGHRRRACVALRGGVGADACNVVQRCVGGALLGKATDCVSFYRGVCATDAGSTCRAQNMALVASCRRLFDCQQRHVPVSSPFMVMVAYPAANIGQYLASEFTVTWLVFWHCFPASLPDICVACCSMAHVRVARWREALRALSFTGCRLIVSSSELHDGRSARVAQCRPCYLAHAPDSTMHVKDKPLADHYLAMRVIMCMRACCFS